MADLPAIAFLVIGLFVLAWILVWQLRQTDDPMRRFRPGDRVVLTNDYTLFRRWFCVDKWTWRRHGSPGDLSEVVDDKGRWVLIRLGEVTGWIERQYLIPLDESAIEFFSDLLVIKPDHEPWKLATVLVWSHLGQPDRALVELDRLIEQNPDHADYYQMRASILVHKKDTKGAIAAYSRAIEISPNPAELYMLRGCQYAISLKADAATDDFQRSFELNPHGETIQKIVAEDHLNYGRYERAVDISTQAINVYPEQLDFYHIRARALSASGEQDLAMSDYQQILRLAPPSIQSSFLKGQVHARLNQFDLVVQEYDRALVRHPNTVNLLSARAQAHMFLGQWQEAINDLREARRVAPDHLAVVNGMALLNALSPIASHRNPERALSLAREAMKSILKVSTSVKGLFFSTLAIAHAANGQFDEAIATEKQALELAAPADRAECEDRLACFERHEKWQLPRRTLVSKTHSLSPKSRTRDDHGP